MAKTKEGGIKAKVKDLLISRGLVPSAKAVNATTTNTGWFHMPVSIGMGVHGIPDFLGHYRGWFFVIETKKSIKDDPTPLQLHQLRAVGITGGQQLVVRCEEDLANVAAWLDEIDRREAA